MSQIDELFRSLRAAQQRILIPFITAGDPDLEFTRQLIRELSRRGASLIEIGIPYSDPIADGPVIQASYTRALSSHVKVHEILDSIASTKSDHQSLIVTMVSYAIIFRMGMESYVQRALAAGVAGAIVPDLPVEESAALAAICRKHDFSLIQLVTPTTPRDRAIRIAETSTGFLYYVSVTGITGERSSLANGLIDNVSWLRQRTELPICIGFGISTPEQVRTLAPFADGLIVGSAIVRQIADPSATDRTQHIRNIGDYVSSLIEALAGA